MTVFLYLAVGAVFAFAASVGFRRGGLPLLALATLLTTVGLLVVALLEMWASGGEAAFGFPVLLAIVPPPVSAGVVHWLATIRASRSKQWLVGMLVWIGLLVPIWACALLLNWVTF